MLDASFTAYVGDPDFHDGTILSVEQRDREARVRVRGASGKVYTVAFSGVSTLRATSPEGMMLYALSELENEPPLRRFCFANWDEDSEAMLQIDAEGFTVIEE